ncbi:MAG: endolytic transglycosylase MltG [Granulosicoccus sp.]|nr:endolytic transglycosylase MltG [Granulosicoccus sp.]
MIRFLLVLLLLSAAGIGWLGWHDYNRYLTTPVNLPEEGRTFTIQRGWSAKRLAAELEKQGIIEQRYWFDLFARLSKQAGGLKSGEFSLTGPMTVPELFDTFIAGQTIQYTQSIIEGSNWRQALKSVRASTSLRHTLADDVLDSPQAIMEKLGFPGLHPEGQFFADTYAFPKGTTDLDYLRRAKQTLDKVLQEEWQTRQDDLPLDDPYQALILASIVEKETAVAAERPRIAGVFLSRLRKNMRLQTDPTVIYGMGESYDGNIRRKDLTTDTPYNTYTRAGLPPTPIAMVGREAIRAVMQPESTTSLYFVARGDGTHQFSDTLEAHNAAVRKYQLRRR